MAVFVALVRRVQGENIVAAKTPAGSQHFRIQMAKGEWVKELIEISQVTANPECVANPKVAKQAQA